MAPSTVALSSPFLTPIEAIMVPFMKDCTTTR
jgi:hypothetical protein